MTALAPKRKERTRMRALLEHLLNQHRQTIDALAHIGDPAGQPYLARARTG